MSSSNLKNISAETVYSEIENELNACDLFISIGTSGQVYPAAMFVTIAKNSGAYTVEVNLEETNISDNFDEHLVGRATQKVSELVDHILSL